MTNLQKPKISTTSAYRHIHHTTWKKELTFTHARIHGTGNRILSASSTMIAIPWRIAGGCAAIYRHDKPRNVTTSNLVVASRKKLNCFEFSPFDDLLFATGADDGFLKFWELPQEGLEGNVEVADRVVDNGGAVQFVKWSPWVNGLMATFSGGNGRIWDVESGLEVGGFVSEKHFHYGEWKYDGLFVASSKDKKMKIYDPRSGAEPVMEYIAHTSPKPFELSILGNSATDNRIPDENLIATVGWGAMSAREISIWDIRSEKYLSKTKIDQSSSWIIPYFDPGTGLLVLVEKGTGIFSFEVTPESPHAWMLNKHTGLSNRQGVCQFPRRSLDIKKTELFRFLIASNTSLETVSLYAPRKDTGIYHEDLYSFVPSIEPTASVENWINGDVNEPLFHKFPEADGLTSIFDIPLEEGGKSRVIEKTKRELGNANVKKLELLDEVSTEIFKEGSWSPTHLKIKGTTLFAFHSKESSEHDESWNIAQFNSIERSESLEISLHITHQEGKLMLRLENQHLRESWLLSLKTAKEKSMVTNTAKDFNDVKILVGSEWIAANLTLQDTVFSIAYTNQNTTIHIDKVISVHQIKGGVGTEYYSLRVLSFDQIFVISFESEEECFFCIEKLEEKRLTGDVVSDSYLVFEGPVISEQAEYHMVAASAYIFLNESQSSQIPGHCIKLSDIKAIQDGPENDILLIFYEEFPDRIIRVFDEKSKWISVLNELKTESMYYTDILYNFGISQNDLPIEESISNLENQLIGHIDPYLNKDGENPVLIKVSGRRKLRISLIHLDAEFLHSGAVFVLDAGKIIYEWRGKKSTTIQKGRALDIIQRIRQQERSGSAKIVKLKQDINDQNNDKFWSFFGGYREITSYVNPTDEDHQTSLVTLYRVMEREVNLVHEGSLPSVKKLKSNGVFLLQYGPEFYAWYGKDSSQRQRKLSLKILKILQDRCEESPMFWCKIVDRGELVIFKEKFCDFPDAVPILKKKKQRANIAKRQKFELNYENLYNLEEEQEYYDGGIGQLSGYLIDDIGRQAIHQTALGQFGAEQGYILQYYYKHKNTESIWGLLFNWQGRIIDNKNKVANAFLMKNCMAEMQDAAIVKQIQLHQFCETDHFLSIFQRQFGCIIYHKNKFVPLWYNQRRLFKIFSIDTLRTYALEVEFDVERLHSGYCYVVVDFPKNTFMIWRGQHSSEHTFSYAQLVIDNIKNYIHSSLLESQIEIVETDLIVLPNENPETEVLLTESSSDELVVQNVNVQVESDYSQVQANRQKDSKEKNEDNYSSIFGKATEFLFDEGKESAEFWNYFGLEHEPGRDSYWTDVMPYVKIYEITSSLGSPNARKVFNIDQSVFTGTLCYMIDFGKAIWIWFSEKASFETRKSSLVVAKNYRNSIQEIPDDTPIFITKQYQEPLAFTQGFPYWETTKYPRRIMLANLEPSTETLESIEDKYFKKIFSIEEIVGVPPEDLPEGVNPAKLETYLDDSDFEEVTGLTRKQFLLMPAWKQQKLKRESKLIFKKEINSVSFIFSAHQN